MIWRRKGRATLAILGPLVAVLLVWQAAIGAVSPFGPGGEALAADFGTLVIAPTPTSTVGASELTITPSPTGTISAGELTITPSATPTITSTVGVETATPTVTSVITETATPTVTVVVPTPTATSVITAPRTITITDFFIDVSVSDGTNTVLLGRALQVQNVTLTEGQLGSVTVFFSNPPELPQFDAALTLAITSFDPLTLELERFDLVAQAGAITVTVTDIGTVVAAVPGTTPINLSASTEVAGVGTVTFTFLGEISTAVP